MKPDKIKILIFLKYKIKIKEKIDIYTNNVPISGWRSKSIITVIKIMELNNK